MMKKLDRQPRDKLDLSNKNWLDIIVDYRVFLTVAVVVTSLVLAVFVSGLTTDPTLKSGVDTTCAAYLQHQKFIDVFGHDEFILVAAKYEKGVGDPQFLKALDTITRDVTALDNIAEVVSLTNLRVFQNKGKLFGNYPVVRTASQDMSLPDAGRLATMKKALPIMDMLISPDLKTAGVLIRVEDECRFDPSKIKKLVAAIQGILVKNLPKGAEHRVIGAALLRQAIVRYNIQTGIIFGILCMLIGTVVSVYVFKSFRVTAVTNVILGTCVLWVLGLMSLLGIPLNSTTALAFGFIPITSLEIVIHMVVRYHQFHQTSKEKIAALKQAVRWLARPCLICVTTTAIGFGTLMVSSIPMVRQLGFIMSVGVLISYCLAMILTPALFSWMKALDAPEESGLIIDWLDNILKRIENTIFAHPRVFVAVGLAFTVVLFAGAPLIRSDTQVLRMLNDSTAEVKDLQFVEKNLTSVNSVELVVKADDNAFKKAPMWKKVSELDQRLKEIPEVVCVDSFLPLLEYLKNLVGDKSGDPVELFTKPDLIPQLLVLTSLGADSNRLVRRYISPDYDQLHVSVRIKNSDTVPISQTIDSIRSASESVMKGVARTAVTGDLAVVADQASDLINDQIRSMFLAAIIISVVMIIQMGSVLVGLISLIPNVPPVAAVFGIMGWSGISLDSITVFAATVAIGLAVDNTIHYLTQLKREIELNPEQGMEECVRSAYRLTAKQISSWSVVTLFGFLALTVSPFRPVVCFGILGCSSILLGLYGDLVFLQSLILSSATIKKAIRKLIDKRLTAANGPVTT
jgi:predicted RND superfamily exporter protein